MGSSAISRCRVSRVGLIAAWIAIGLLAGAEPARPAVALRPGATPAALPLPASSPLPSTAAPAPDGSAASLSPRAPAEQPVKLFPGQRLQPIDLASALSLAGVRNPVIGTARQRVLQAVADLEQARALWLPSFFIGPTYYRADGQVQDITGKVETVDRGSLFLGATAALANGFPSPSPGTGFPALNGLSAVLRISDAIYEPLAAGRVAAANQAALQATANDTLLAVSEAYFDLQLATGALAIASEAASNAAQLAEITGAYAQVGQGLEADHRRAQAEYRRRRREIQLTSGQVKVASANLIRPLILDPQLVVAPVEPAEAIIRLIPDEAPLDQLICEGMTHRPELAQAQEMVKATIYRLKQAKLRPFVPALALTYAGGGFGGGPGSFFGNFNTRGDAAASLYWDIRNLGFTDLAICHRRRAEQQAAGIDLVGVQARVAADIVAAYEARAAASGQMIEARDNVARGRRLAQPQLHRHPAGCTPPRSDPPHRGPPADPGTRSGPRRLP